MFEGLSECQACLEQMDVYLLESLPRNPHIAEQKHLWDVLPSYMEEFKNYRWKMVGLREDGDELVRAE